MIYEVRISYKCSFEFNDCMTAMNFACLAAAHRTEETAVDSITIIIRSEEERESNE